MSFTFEKDDIINKNIPPDIIGVYYFLDSSYNILYIGKSIDVKKRISQHFYKGRKRLLSACCKIRVVPMHSELEALLFESQEIKKYKPIFNRRLRKSKQVISLYSCKKLTSYSYYYLGREGQQNDSLIDFMSLKSAKSFLTKLTSKFQLCEKINKLDKSSKMCFQYHLKKCNGACIKMESIEDYNTRFESSYSQIFNNPIDCCLTFNIDGVKTYVNIENNKLVKFGVKGKSTYSIDFPSYDEIKIVNLYKNRFSKNFEITIEKTNNHALH